MHANETRVAPVVTKGHSYHVAASTNPDGTLNIAELKNGAAHWIAEYRKSGYSLQLFVEPKISDTVEVLIIVRRKGNEPGNYDLDKIEAITAQWFDELAAASYKVTGEEHAINATDDLIVFVRQKL